jgi:hypothetical protein
MSKGQIINTYNVLLYMLIIALFVFAGTGVALAYQDKNMTLLEQHVWSISKQWTYVDDEDQFGDDYWENAAYIEDCPMCADCDGYALTAYAESPEYLGRGLLVLGSATTIEDGKVVTNTHAMVIFVGSNGYASIADNNVWVPGRVLEADSLDSLIPLFIEVTKSRRNNEIISLYAKELPERTLLQQQDLNFLKKYPNKYCWVGCD